MRTASQTSDSSSRGREGDGICVDEFDVSFLPLGVAYSSWEAAGNCIARYALSYRMIF